MELIKIITKKEINNNSSEEKDLTIEKYERKYFVSEEEICGEIKKEVLLRVKMLLELNMEEEIERYIGTKKWEHKTERSGYRKGYYRRSIMTSLGDIAQIEVPRIREGNIKFKFIGKYKRRTKEVDNLMMNKFLEGISTRRVEEVLKPFYGKRLASATLVSKVTKELNIQVEKYPNRAIEDKYEYLIFNGIWINPKSPVYKRRRCVLVAYGLWEEAGKLRREIIDFKIVFNGESQQAWENFIVGLKMRGLFGKKIKLIMF